MIDNMYNIDDKVVCKYVQAINSISIPMNKIKLLINNSKDVSALDSNIYDDNDIVVFDSIKDMINSLKAVCENCANEQVIIMKNTIKEIMKCNNGIISSRMIEPLNISRAYLSQLTNDNEIERVSRGIYISKDSFEDSFYSFQSKYKKAVFSHMNALYFFNMTEEVPYNFTVTVPQRYHVDNVNKKCSVFYVSDNLIDLGLVDVKTPNGNIVKAYDIERCICDIIKSKNRLDFEQVKKCVRAYMKSGSKDINKLIFYADKLNIKKQVMDFVGMYD